MPRHTVDGTDLMALQALQCQPNVLVQCGVEPKPLGGSRADTPKYLKALPPEQCVIIGKTTVVIIEMIFKSKTAVATSFTSLRCLLHTTFGIAVMVKVSMRSQSTRKCCNLK